MDRTQQNYEKVFEKGEIPIRVADVIGENTTNPVYYHSEMEFQLICQGNGQYFIEGTNYPFRKNSVLIIHNNDMHNFIAGKEAVRRIRLLVSPKVFKSNSLASNLLSDLGSVHHIILNQQQASAAEIALHEIARDCRDRELYWWEMVINNLLRLLIIMRRGAVASQSTKTLQNNPLVQEIIAYLDKNYSEDISLISVANHFFISQYTLSKVFKEYVGIGFKEYLIHRRIMEAKKLLENTDMKVVTIASQVGFDNLSAFNRGFRIITGINPSSYRKSSS